MTLTTTTRAAAAGALLTVLLAGFATTAAAQTPALATSPESAIRQHVETNGGAYAGDCAATVSPRDIGMICSRLVESRPTAQVYLAGRTFSEFDTWLFVAQSPLGWRVVLALPLDLTNSTGVPPTP